jgi:hypothetical protein
LTQPNPWEPNDLETEVLRILNGEDVPGWTWGAAMSVCCQTLKGMGLATGMYEITQKGRDYLAAKDNK